MVTGEEKAKERVKLHNMKNPGSAYEKQGLEQKIKGGRD
jgi:hypothetical protein